MYCYNDKKICCVTKKYSLVIVTKRNLTKNICYQTKYFVILTEWYQQYFFCRTCNIFCWWLTSKTNFVNLTKFFVCTTKFFSQYTHD